MAETIFACTITLVLVGLAAYGGWKLHEWFFGEGDENPQVVAKIQTAIDKVKGIDPDPNYPPKSPNIKSPNRKKE